MIIEKIFVALFFVLPSLGKKNENKIKIIHELTEDEILKETELRIYKNSINNYKTASLSEINDIVKYVDVKKPSVVVTFGFNEGPDSAGPKDVVSALIETNTYNVFLLDWSKRSDIGALKSLTSENFDKAINNVQLVGGGLGKQIQILTNGTGIHTWNMTLVGHSVGALLMGEVGSWLYKQRLLINTIWGLDPVGKIYDDLFGDIPRLHRRAAKFVYVIHTDPQGFGNNDTLSTIDFVVNFSSQKYNTQPGCTGKANPRSLSPKSLCNHNRAWELFAEGVRDPASFPAVAAVGGLAWLAGAVDSKRPVAYIRMEPTIGGYGRYFLRTNDRSPYGMKVEGTYGVESLDPPDAETMKEFKNMMAQQQNSRKINIKLK